MLTLLPLSDHIHLHTPDHFQPLTAHLHLGTPHILLHNPLVCCMGSLRIPNLLHLQQPGQLLLQLGSLMVQVIISTMMSPTHTLRPQVSWRCLQHYTWNVCSITISIFWTKQLHPYWWGQGSTGTGTHQGALQLLHGTALFILSEVNKKVWATDQAVWWAKRSKTSAL